MRRTLATYWAIGATGGFGGEGLARLLRDAHRVGIVLLIMAVICYVGSYLLIRSSTDMAVAKPQSAPVRHRALTLAVISGGLAATAIYLLSQTLFDRQSNTLVTVSLTIAAVLGLVGALAAARYWRRNTISC